MNKMERNSAHELLRLLAMFIIIWYHLISYYLYLTPHDNSFDSILEATLPSLHIGVILFLLISGYYGIKPSLNGFLRLLAIVAIYYLPVEIIRCLHHRGNIIETMMFITNTPYWFIRTYLFLYVLTPIINRFTAASSSKLCNLILLALGVISVYFGTTKGDPSLIDGKNVVNFMFLYLLGFSVRRYQSLWTKVSGVWIFSIVTLLNVITVGCLITYSKATNVGGYVWLLTFPYNSPLLILNSLLVFLLFSKLKIQSHVVNVMALSTFAVYLIHCHPAVHKYIIMPLVDFFMVNGTYSSVTCYFFLSATMALVVLFGSICIDKALYPIWKLETISRSRLLKLIA